MDHCLFGGSIPLLIGIIVYLARGFRATFRMLVALPVAMALFMLWSVAPDLPRLFGDQELYRRLYNDPRCNIFLWHYYLDVHESKSPLITLGFILMLAIVLFIAWRELNLMERIKKNQ
jgi:hypothetical protein